MIVTTNATEFAKTGDFKYEITSDASTYTVNSRLTGINNDEFVVISND